MTLQDDCMMIYQGRAARQETMKWLGVEPLLEKIGVTARTTKTKAQRAAPKKAAATRAVKKAASKRTVEDTRSAPGGPGHAPRSTGAWVARYALSAASRRGRAGGAPTFQWKVEDGQAEWCGKR